MSESFQRLEHYWDNGTCFKFILACNPHPDEQHTDSVYSIQRFQNYLVRGSKDKSIRLWNLTTRTLEANNARDSIGLTQISTCLEIPELFFAFNSMLPGGWRAHFRKRRWKCHLLEILYQRDHSHNQERTQRFSYQPQIRFKVPRRSFKGQTHQSLQSPRNPSYRRWVLLVSSAWRFLSRREPGLNYPQLYRNQNPIRP